MADLKSDLEFQELLFKSEKNGDFDQVYPRPTENIEYLLDCIDMSGKDVYGVLASSEIVFQSKLRGAKSIRAFDINPLTYRYYFFRKWLLEQGYTFADDLKRLEILDIIDKHYVTTNIDEEESVEFWKKHLSIRENQKFFSDEFFRLYTTYFFQMAGRKYPISYEGRTKALAEMIKDFELEFDLVDICEPLEIEEQFDIVYLSNIMDLKNDTKVIRDNLHKMLRENGEVICTNIVNPPYFKPFEWQKKTFAEKFEYDELFIERPGIVQNEDNQIKYYRYIKK